jgi:hypothetical protein
VEVAWWREGVSIAVLLQAGVFVVWSEVKRGGEVVVLKWDGWQRVTSKNTARRSQHACQQRLSQDETPRPKPPTPKRPPPRYCSAHHRLSARSCPPCPSPWLRGRRAIPIGKQSAEVLAGWLSRRSRGIARISKDTTATNKSTHHHHHNEGPIDSAPAHFLASMALRSSSGHRPRLSGPAATAARRLLFHTRQPGSRQEE